MAGFGGSVKLTGETEYKKALTGITQSLREVGSEMKLVSSEYGKNDKSTQALNAKSQVLNKQLDAQKTKLELLKGQYSELSETEDENSVAMSKLRVQMNQAQSDINKTTHEIDELGKETDDTTEKVKASGDGFTVFKGILANLGTQAINGAINGLKSMGGALMSVGKQALESYAQYEQLTGGVDTLFKDSSKKVQEYANNAYKTAGMSANEYMETVTSFSASMIQSLGGDTAKASEYSNKAITDMSDNANKMGTSMESLQNAYAGFAKGNYTMLDNLKLGYGGTKSEMERLIADANKVKEANGEMGNLSIESFADVTEAIHTMQSEMGITGTTAKEASTTIEGSVNSMKGAWSNLITGIADDNADFDGLVTNFVDSIVTMGNNILPRIQTIIQGMGTMASQLISKLVPEIVKTIPPLIQQTLPILLNSIQSAITAILDVLPQVADSLSSLIPTIVQMLLGMLPQLLEVGIQILLSLVNGITQALPQLIAMLPTIITDTVNTLIENLPAIINAGIQLLIALINGIVQALPQLVQMLPSIIDTTVTVLMDNLPMIIDAGIQLLVALINGIVQATPQLVAMLPQIIITTVSTLTRNFPKILQAGGQLVASLINGISSMLGNLGNTAMQIFNTIKDKITQLPQKALQWGKDMIQGFINGIKGMICKVGDAVKGVADKIKNFLHFSRPDVGPLRDYETWMPDMIEGLSKSLEKASPNLVNQTKALAGQMSDALNVDGSINAPSGSYGSTSYNLVESFKQALSEMKIEMDDEQMGKFVDKTVANAIYT